MSLQTDSNGRIIHGDILVEESAFLPQPLHLESDPAGAGWARVANHLNGPQLEKELAAVGWTCFYMAGAIRKIAFGFEGAMKSVVEAVRLQKCNCLEVDEVAAHSFLGIPYVSVSAHARHIQKAGVFSGQ